MKHTCSIVRTGCRYIYLPNLAWDRRYRAQRIRVTGINTESEMTNEHTSRPYITLDWADVKAWVKSNPRTNTNRHGGYYTECPVPTHKTDDYISVWDGDDYIGLKCFGDCTYRDMLEAIAKSIKTSALNWADVEAWVKSNPRANTNRHGGYYTECPVPTHKTDDYISVWDGDDHIGLKCFGDCTYWDVLEAIAKATKTSAAPDTSSPTTVRPRSTLDWADVEAWVKHQPHTSRNWVVGGYYTDCPVSTHKTGISIWSGDDGGIGLKCWGGCRYGDIRKALTNVIKTGGTPVTEPQAATETRIKELQAALAVAETHVRTLQAEKSDWADQLAATEEEAEQENQKRIASETRVQELEREQSHLEKTLTSTEEERKRESAARIAAQNEIRRIQAEKTRSESDLADAEAPKAELENRLAAVEEERKRESAARIAAQNEVRKLKAENSGLVDQLAVTKPERERGGNGRLSSAWRLFSKEEPTYAFVDAMCILENDLHQLVGHGQWPRPQLERMLTAACELHLIDEKKQNRLQDMRRKRNRVLHENQRLREPQTREDLAYLEQVIGQLGS